MPSLVESFPDIVRALTDRYGQPPAPDRPEEPFEAILTAMLGRSHEPRGTGAIRDALRDAGLLEPEELAAAGRDELAEILRSARAGDSARILGPILRLAAWFASRSSTVDEAATDALREELIALNGVGPASADTVLLLGLGRPVFPVDRAAYRILVRHGWIDPEAAYDEAREAIERPAGADAEQLARVAAWLEPIGADFCRPARARCESCPLRPWLPDGGPIDPQSLGDD